MTPVGALGLVMEGRRSRQRTIARIKEGPRGLIVAFTSGIRAQLRTERLLRRLNGLCSPESEQRKAGVAAASLLRRVVQLSLTGESGVSLETLATKDHVLPSGDRT